MLLQMTNISKAFSGVQALDDVQLHLESGEVLALMGENGAGKSTLMKILTGIYERDNGTVSIHGEEKVYTNTREAQEDGVVMVHQELNLLNDLKVYENIFIGREMMKSTFIIDDQKLIQLSKILFEDLGVKIDPNSFIRDLTVGEAQMVEIAKAISMQSRIIVFDEPTAALSTREIKELFKIIGDLKEKGVGIIYISHRMDEIQVISDKITVLRDGKYIDTVITKDTSNDDLIHLMVGRTLIEEPKLKSNVEDDAEIILEVTNLSSGRMVKDVSFNLRKGEILGISGLMGAGRTESVRAIFGADPVDSGTVKIHGKEVNIKNTSDATALGLGYISEDRRRYGVLTEHSIVNNIVLNSIDDDINNMIIQESKSLKRSEIYREKLRVKSQNSHQLVKNLSGGNQQKVVISKWLAKDSEIIIMDEPTRGIDVGAKAEIYELMDELIKEGKSIIMISSELSEILKMSDRIVVMCEGRNTGELSIEEATQEKIMKLATIRNGETQDEKQI